MIAYIRQTTKKGRRRGYYTLKRTIKVAEYAVINELLFREFNAAPVAVGMDIIAHKDNKTFHIQVKTSIRSNSGKHAATIKQTKFAHADDIYYIVVLRINDIQFHFF
ncbi:MAG: hypothetical protein OCD03_16400 [Hyphomicrobiales bacterium]